MIKSVQQSRHLLRDISQNKTALRHTIKPGTPEHGTTEHGTPAEHRNTGGSYNRILAEQSEYHGIVEHEKSSGTT